MTFESGKQYIGKGTEKRMELSGKQVAEGNKDKVIKSNFEPSKRTVTLRHLKMKLRKSETLEGFLTRIYTIRLTHLAKSYCLLLPSPQLLLVLHPQGQIKECYGRFTHLEIKRTFLRGFSSYAPLS